jgi:hypothetical protein
MGFRVVAASEAEAVQTTRRDDMVGVQQWKQRVIMFPLPFFKNDLENRLLDWWLAIV